MCEESLFDPVSYYPALALIRIPKTKREKAPAPDADFGSGFFGGCEGLLFTARHNVVRSRTYKPLAWVWVCCYEESTKGWTDCRKVEVNPQLLDKGTDAALLCVPGITPKVLPLSLDWRRGDDAVVLGFQQNPVSDPVPVFEPQYASCLIRRNEPLGRQDFQDEYNPGELTREPCLNLQYTSQAIYENERVLRGFSGGPVLDTRGGTTRVIAIVKAVEPLDPVMFVLPYVLATPLQWVKPLFDRLPVTMHPFLHSPSDEDRSPFQSYIDEKIRDFVGREFVLAALDNFLKDKDRGYFIIYGEPGIGKTSLSAYLVRERNYVHHFNDASSGIIRSDLFLNNVCRQLIARHQRGRHFDPKKDCLDGQYLQQLLDDISRRLSPGSQLIILVDALDEAATPANPNENLLYLPRPVPKGIYFVLTTRPLENLPLFIESPREDFPLDPESPGNQFDIQRYIRQWVDRGPLMVKLRDKHVTVDDFVAALSAKSEGNFMYLSRVLPELERGEMETDELPQGLRGYYERHWQKMKSRDWDQWVRMQQPVISVLAAVREPASVKQVADYIPGLTPAQVASVISDWRQFLRESWIAGEKCYRLYHSSFQGFLKNKDEVGEVDLRKTNRAIAKVLDQVWKAYLKQRKD